jgi:hypothetical protein
MEEAKNEAPKMRIYNFWVCKETFIFKEGPKGDTRYGRGTLLILPEEELPPGEERRFKKLENIRYQEPEEVESL